eukprot:scaffold18102_cov129-Isochrysis_galbana.AAC.2
MVEPPAAWLARHPAQLLNGAKVEVAAPPQSAEKGGEDAGQPAGLAGDLGLRVGTDAGGPVHLLHPEHSAPRLERLHEEGERSRQVVRLGAAPAAVRVPGAGRVGLAQPVEGKHAPPQASELGQSIIIQVSETQACARAVRPHDGWASRVRVDLERCDVLPAQTESW